MPGNPARQPEHRRVRSRMDSLQGQPKTGAVPALCPALVPRRLCPRLRIPLHPLQPVHHRRLRPGRCSTHCHARARGSGSTSSASSASSVHVDGGASHPPAAANHGSSPLRQVSGTPSLQLQTQQAQQTLMFTGPPSAAGAAFRTASPPGFEAALPVTTAAAPATTMAPVTSIQQHQLPAVTAPSYHPHQHSQYAGVGAFHQHAMHAGQRQFRPAVQVHH